MGSSLNDGPYHLAILFITSFFIVVLLFRTGLWVDDWKASKFVQYTIALDYYYAEMDIMSARILMIIQTPGGIWSI